MYVSDPMQSLYNFGINARHLVESGVDFFTANIVATGLYMNKAIRPFCFHRYMAIVPHMKALTRTGTIYQMLGVRDDAEEWDVIHHAANQFERDIYAARSYYLLSSDGLDPCIEKAFVTLGDGIDSQDWCLTNKYLDASYSLNPTEIISPLLYWSDTAFENMLDEYIHTRRWHSAKLMAELQAHGGYCGGVVRSEMINKYHGTLFVPCIDLLSDSERSELLNSGCPILAFAPKDYDSASLHAVARIEDCFSDRPLQAFLLNIDPPADITPVKTMLARDDGTTNLSENLLTLDDTRSFMDYEMWLCKVTSGFMEAAAWLFRYMDGCTNPFSSDIPMQVYCNDDGSYRLYLYNRYEDHYDLGIVRSKRKIVKTHIVFCCNLCYKSRV